MNRDANPFARITDEKVAKEFLGMDFWYRYRVLRKVGMSNSRELPPDLIGLY